MLNKTRRLITGTALSFFAAIMLLLFSATQVMAAGGARTTAGAQTTNSASGWSGGSGIISTADWIVFAGAHAVTVDSATTLLSVGGGQDTASMVAGANAGVVHVATANVLQLTGGTTGSSSLTFNVGHASNTVVHQLILNGDAYDDGNIVNIITDAGNTVVGTVNVGDGTGTTTFSGKIDVSSAAADGRAIVNLNEAILDHATLGLDSSSKAGDVDINILGNTTFSGAIDISEGQDNNLVQITDAMTLTLASTFNAHATGVISLGTGTTGGTLLLTGTDKTITGLIKGADSNAGYGTLSITGGGTTTITNNVGTTSSLAAINVASTSTVAAFSGTIAATQITLSNTGTNTFAGDTTANVAFAADGAVTVANDADIVGNITNTTGSAGNGTMTWAGAADRLMTGNVGAGTDGSLKALVIAAGGDGASHTFSGTVAATTITVTGASDSADEVIFQGNVAGNIVITVGGLMTFTADETLTGNITTTVTGQGKAVFTESAGDTAIVTGSIGASGKLLAQVTAGAATTKTATITGDIFATAITITNGAADGTVAFGGNVTGATTFSAAGTATMAADKIFTGAIITAGDNTGTLTFAANTAGDQTLVSTTTGASGADLLLVTVNPIATTTQTFTGRVYANNVTNAGAGTLAYTAQMDGITNITADGYVTLGNTHTGAINTGTAGQGTVTAAAGIGITGAVGGTGALKALIMNSQGGTSALGAAVTAATITLNGTGNTTAAATLTGAVVFGAAGTLTPAADVGIVGAVTTTAGNGTGTLTFTRTANSTTLVSTTTGADGAALLALTAGSESGARGTFGGAVYANTITLQGNSAAGIVKFSGNVVGNINMDQSGGQIIELADGVNVTGNITATTDNVGKVTVMGTSTIDGSIDATGGTLLEVDVDASASLTLTGNNYATSTLIASGGSVKWSHATASLGNEIIDCAAACTLDLGTATVSATAVTYSTAASTLKVTIGTVDGKLVGTGTILGNTGNTFVPTIVGAVVSGEYLTIVDAATGSAHTIPGDITDNYERYDFTLVNGSHASCSTLDLCLVATVVTPAGISGNSAAVSAIADVAFAGDDTMATAINGLSGAVLEKALVTLAPAVSGGAIAGAVSAGGAAGATISTQMASLRSGIAAGQGLNAGDGAATEERFWSQGFGTYGEQDIRQKIAGFTTATGGVAFGADRRFRDDLVLGLAYSFSHTSIDGSESKNETKVMGHQATLYGSHDFDRGIFDMDGVFLDGQLSYAYNDYEGERYIEVGAVSRRADSSYDGLQISSSFNLGKTFKLDEGFRFTPMAGLSYSHVSIDSYNETNAGDSGLKLQDQDYDMLNFNLKGKVARTWQVDGIDVTPEVHLGYSYEAIHDKIQTVSSFQGGGNAFTTTGFTTANSTYQGGIGATWGGDSLPVDVTLTYDISVKDDYMGHSGLVKGVWRF